MTANKKEDLFYKLLANDFSMFIEKCYAEIDGGQKFVETIATKLIIDKLLAVEEGTIKRSIINVPPRTLKSTIVSIAFTAWLLGHNPKLKILCISYGDDLAKDFSIKVRQIMTSDWYKKAFPKTRLWIWGKRDNLLQTTSGGFRRSASLEGSLTGHGADIIIIDDPQKAAEVLSDQVRKKTNEIFSNTIISRLNNKVKGKIIVVAQRLHQDDFSNYVQKYDNWDVLKIPAIAEKDITYKLSNGKIIIRKADEVINPEIEPLDILLKIKRGMGDFNFSAQYQQEPIPSKGNIIKFDDFKWFTQKEIAGERIIVQSWDCAQKTGENNDFSVCVTAAICNEIVYILDTSRYKLEFPDLLAEIKRMSNVTNANTIIIEDAGIGSGIIQQLDRENFPVYPYKPKDSKTIRAEYVTKLIRDGKVRLLKGASWLDEFAKEVRAFPYGAHDDQVDALVQLLILFDANVIVSPSGSYLIDSFNDYELDEDCRFDSYFDSFVDDI